jgi:hypothetical protein
MGSRYVRSVCEADAGDLEYRINKWCENHNAEPVSVSVSRSEHYVTKLVALVVMEEKDDVI